MTGDAVDRLASTLDALDEHLKTSDATVRRSVRYRLTLLHVHAFWATYIGFWFTQVDRVTMAGTAWAVIRAVPGAPTTLGVLLGTGGIVLGVCTWRRWLGGEIVGLCILLAWYSTIAASFGGALVWWWLGRFPAGTPRPAPYSHGVYLHLTTVMVIHIGVLIRQRRALRVR